MTKRIPPQTVAMTLITSNTMKEAASELNVCKATLGKLKKEPQVQEALKQLAGQLYETELTRLMVNVGKSVNVLEGLANGDFQDSSKALVQLSACKYLLEITQKGYELQCLEQRLNKLENVINVQPY